MSAGQKFKCEVCGKEFKSITNSHLKKHDMTTIEYKNKFPNSLLGNFDRFDNWRNSEENKNNCKNMSKIVYSSKDLQTKRLKAVKKATQSKDYKIKQSKIMKDLFLKNPTKYISDRKTEPTEWMKKSNYERWEILYGKKEAEKRQLEWSKKNKLPSKSKFTKPEKLFASLLDKLELNYETQYAVNKYKCDFFIPKYNLIVEIDGDYWHANPAKYKENDLIGGKKMLAKDIWKKDNNKTLDILNEGYKVLRYWASSIKNTSHEKIFEDIVHTFSKDKD